MFPGGFPYNPVPFGYYNAVPQQAQSYPQQSLPQWAIPPYLGGGGTPQYSPAGYGGYPQPAMYAPSNGYAPQAGYTAAPSYQQPAYGGYPSYTPQTGYTGGQSIPQQSIRPNIPILFRPVIVQNQSNQLPLRNLGGLNAVMNAAALLNVQPGMQVQ